MGFIFGDPIELTTLWNNFVGTLSDERWETQTMARPSFKLNFFGDYIFHLGKINRLNFLFCLVPND